MLLFFQLESLKFKFLVFFRLFWTGITWSRCHFSVLFCLLFPDHIRLNVSSSSPTLSRVLQVLDLWPLPSLFQPFLSYFPENVVTDNGANLASEEFENYLETQGIQHRKVTPYWPQVNAEVKRFNRKIENAIRTAQVEGKDWRKDMFTFLLNYRATPHATTGASPALLHLGREIRTKVPQVETQLSDALSAAVQSAKVEDRQDKQRMKAYVDMRNRASPSVIASGDKVLLKQARQNKLSTLYTTLTISQC